MSPDNNDRDDLPGKPPDTSLSHPASESPSEPVAEPGEETAEEPADSAELAQAAAFAQLIDTTIAGGDLPAVMAAEQRSLVETAAILRANLRADGSVGSGVSDVVSQVMGQLTDQLTGTSHKSDEESNDNRPPAGERDADVIDFAARRRRRVRWLSVSTAAVAAAVVLFFALRTPGPSGTSDAPSAPTLSMIHHSRPADPLIGEIPRERADRASDRLDTIYADRMAGYRDLRFQGGAR